MKVDAGLIADPDRLLNALIMFTRSRLWSEFFRPTHDEWARDWYRDPGSAWWEL